MTDVTAISSDAVANFLAGVTEDTHGTTSPRSRGAEARGAA